MTTESLTRRIIPHNVDYVDVMLWLFRAAIIILVIYGIMGKIVLGRGNDYSGTDWIDFTISGLSQGSLYALIALGYTLVYGVLFMINFAHGEFFTAGAMTATIFVALPLDAAGFLNEQPVISLIVIFLTAMITSVIVAVLTERIAYRPLRRAPRLVPLITAIGASFFLQYFLRGLYGSQLWPFPTIDILQGNITVLGISISKIRLMVMVTAVLMLIGLNMFVMRTKTGRAIRAVAENKDVAALMGVDVDRTIAITFAVGAAMAGAAGVLYAMVFRQLDPFMGFVPGIKAFTAAVLGGIGSIPGAAIGGLLLGFVESVGPPFVLEGLGLPSAHQLKDVFAFVMLVLVLIFRPQGIVGERIQSEKA